MTDVVILQDCAGRPERRRALRSVHPYVRVVAPRELGVTGAVPLDVPEEWLPVAGERRHWWKADAVALSAVRSRVHADYYWFIESDVVATPEVWRKLFDLHRGSTADCLTTTIGRRGPESRFRHWDHPGTPPDATRHFIMAVYRLSRAAVQASITMAPDLRETFSEVAVPYVMRRFGLAMAEFSGNLWTPSSMRVRESEVRISRGHLNHPVKADSYAPPP